MWALGHNYFIKSRRKQRKKRVAVQANNLCFIVSPLHSYKQTSVQVMFDHNDHGHAVCLVCKCNSDDTERRNSRHFSLGSILTKDGWFLSASLLFPHTDVSIYWRLSWRLVAGRLLVIQYTCLKEHTAAGGLHMDGLYVRAGEAGRSLNIRRLDLDTEISYKNVLDSHFPQCTDSQEQRGGIKK